MANEDELTSEFGGEAAFLPSENVTTAYTDQDGNEIPDVCDTCQKNRSCMCIQGNTHLVKYCWNCWKKEQDKHTEKFKFKENFPINTLNDSWTIEL